MTHSARFIAFCLFYLLVSPALADVVVVANKSQRHARFALLEDDRDARDVSLEPGASVVLHVAGSTKLCFFQDADPGESQNIAQQGLPAAGPKEYRIDADSAYFFHDLPGEAELGLRKIGLVIEQTGPEPGIAVEKEDRVAMRAEKAPPQSARPSYHIPVKILVDDDERATRRAWESRLRDRLNAASRLFESNFGVAFDVVAVDTWKSNNAVGDFAASLDEFERAVLPKPARIAIGFTSQYQTPERITNVGGTRLPLGSHILVREWSQHFSERERYELLVHELGHWLGAVHSPEANSVMRPQLGDRQALAKSFLVGFDPLNALAIGLVTEQLHRSELTSLGDLPSVKVQRLQEIYATLFEAMPEDPAAGQFLRLVGKMPVEDRTDRDTRELAGESTREPLPASKSKSARRERNRSVSKVAVKSEQRPVKDEMRPDEREPFVAATRAVLAAIVEMARSNANLQESGKSYLDGDDLTEAYVRAAAEAALDLPAGEQVKSFFFGLAIGLERTEEMRRYPVLGDFIRRIEPEAQRRLRLSVLGRPTWGRREDLSQHVAFSAAIAAMAGQRAAEAAGMAKEFRDARTTSGFSFADWCADRAGIVLADRVEKGAVTLDMLARRFMATDYLPDIEGLDEGLSWDEFSRRYGSTSDRRFRAVDADIRRRIEELYDSRRRTDALGW